MRIKFVKCFLSTVAGMGWLRMRSHLYSQRKSSAGQAARSSSLIWLPRLYSQRSPFLTD